MLNMALFLKEMQDESDQVYKEMAKAQKALDGEKLTSSESDQEMADNSMELQLDEPK